MSTIFTDRFIHLTDPHLIAADDKLYGTDPFKRFAQALQSIQQAHTGVADFAVITGDLAHWGEPGAYQKLKSLLDTIEMPVDLIIGNHDIREAFREVFPDACQDGNGFVQGYRDTGSHRLVFLDTVVPGTHAGGYCEQRCQWLDDVLSSSMLPTLLFMHHPPFEIGIPSMDAIALRDRDRLGEVIKPHSQNIQMLFYGHVHRPICGTWHGIATSTIYGTNHQVALDFDGPEDKIPGIAEGPAYSVVLAGQDHVVVHQHQYLAHAEHYPLSGAYGKSNELQETSAL